MENSNYAAIHTGRVTIQAKDIQHVMRILDVKVGYKTDSPVIGLKKGITVTEDDRKKQLELLKEGRLKGKKRSYLESESEDSDASRNKRESGDSSSSDNGKSGNKGKPKSMKDKVEKKGDMLRGDSSSSDNRKSNKKGKPKWMKDKVEKKDGDKSKGKPCHKNEDGADKSKGKDRTSQKEKGKVGKKTATKSSISGAGMKSDREKSDSGQNNSKPGTSRGSKPGTSRVISPEDKKGKGKKDEPILHIGGNDDIPPYACGICKSRFFLPRSLLVYIEHICA